MAFDPISTALQLGGKLVDHFFPDPEKRAAAQLELLKLAQTGELAQLAADTDLAKGQLEINKIEAASPLTFVSGARPFVMWVCGGALAVNYVIGPLFAWSSALFGHALLAPKLDMAELFPLLMALLGLGAMRTVEKVNGVASK